MDGTGVFESGDFLNWNWTEHNNSDKYSILDTGKNWNWSLNKGKGASKVPVDGIYEITTSVRTADGSSFISYGIGGGCVGAIGEGSEEANCDNGNLSAIDWGSGTGKNEGDTPAFLWMYSNSERQTATPNIRMVHLVKGDQVGLYYFTNDGIGVSDISMRIKLVSTD